MHRETPCLTSTPGAGGGGSSASLRASSVGATEFGPLGNDLILGLPLPLERGLPGGGRLGAGETTRFSFSSACTGDLRMLRSSGIDAMEFGEVGAAGIDKETGVAGLLANLRTCDESFVLLVRPRVIG